MKERDGVRALISSLQAISACQPASLASLLGQSGLSKGRASPPSSLLKNCQCRHEAGVPGVALESSRSVAESRQSGAALALGSPWPAFAGPPDPRRSLKHSRYWVCTAPTVHAQPLILAHLGVLAVSREKHLLAANQGPPPNPGTSCLLLSLINRWLLLIDRRPSLRTPRRSYVNHRMTDLHAPVHDPLWPRETASSHRQRDASP